MLAGNAKSIYSCQESRSDVFRWHPSVCRSPARHSLRRLLNDHDQMPQHIPLEAYTQMSIFQNHGAGSHLRMSL